MDKLSWWMDSCLIASCQYTDDIFVRQGVAPDRHTLIYYAPDNSRYNPETTAPIRGQAMLSSSALARATLNGRPPGMANSVSPARYRRRRLQRYGASDVQHELDRAALTGWTVAGGTCVASRN